MADKITRNLIFENARIIFRNFRGVEGQYNPKGSRNFGIVLDKEQADSLSTEGWNVKTRAPREEGDEPLYFLPVAVRYGNFPPKIVLVTGKNKIPMDEEDVGQLDMAEIENVDVMVRPYNWEANGKSGTKAYVKSLYVTIVEDELEKKYADIDKDDFEELDEDVPF